MENRRVGMKSRGVYETPGGTILYTALRELEMLTLDTDCLHFKQNVAQTYADLVYGGKWFTPLRESLEAFMEKVSEFTTGTVRLVLYKGNIVIAGRKSPYSLYLKDLASFGATSYDHADATGFINLYGLPAMVASLVHGKKSRADAVSARWRHPLARYANAIPAKRGGTDRQANSAERHTQTIGIVRLTCTIQQVCAMWFGRAGLAGWWRRLSAAALGPLFPGPRRQLLPPGKPRLDQTGQLLVSLVVARPHHRVGGGLLEAPLQLAVLRLQLRDLVGKTLVLPALLVGESCPSLARGAALRGRRDGGASGLPAAASSARSSRYSS